MKYLLDTNIVSQYTKAQPDPRVERWLESVDDSDLHISIVTISELWYGISLLPAGRKRSKLELWMEDELSMQFFNRVEFFGLDAAQQYGRMVANAKKHGFETDPLDAMIAAIALVGGMAVATLNRKHFDPLGIPLAEL